MANHSAEMAQALMTDDDRKYLARHDPSHPGDGPVRLLASIPKGQRDRSKYVKANRIWKDWHETRRVLERLSEDVPS